MTCKGGSVCVRECVENFSIGERKRRGERENKRKKEREREREKKEKAGEGEGVLSLFYSHCFFSGNGTLHFISVFGRIVMTWQHSSLPLLSHTVFLILSLFLQLTHSLPCTLPFPRPLPPFSLSLPLSPPHLCVISISVCLIMNTCDV